MTKTRLYVGSPSTVIDRAYVHSALNTADVCKYEVTTDRLSVFDSGRPMYLHSSDLLRSAYRRLARLVTTLQLFIECLRLAHLTHVPVSVKFFYVPSTLAGNLRSGWRQRSLKLNTIVTFFKHGNEHLSRVCTINLY